MSTATEFIRHTWKALNLKPGRSVDPLTALRVYDVLLYPGLADDQLLQCRCDVLHAQDMEQRIVNSKLASQYVCMRVKVDI